jgi:hypothetical protein
MTVRCEFVREVKMRISKFYDGCFHELVEKYFLSKLFSIFSDSFPWKYVVLNIVRQYEEGKLENIENELIKVALEEVGSFWHLLRCYWYKDLP